MLTDKAQAARRDDPGILDNYALWIVPVLGAFHTKLGGCRMTINEHWGRPNTKYPGNLWKENALLARKAISAGWKSKTLPQFRPSHDS
jgi:hypothetical protein